MKKLNIFLLGGTKDSTNIIKHLKNKYESFILTTTTTEYGAKLAEESGSDETIARPLLKDEITEILKENNFDMLIDATHPFASHITQTCIQIKNELNIKYIRFERPATDFKNIDTSNIIYVNSFDEAGKLIAGEFSEKNVLHFAGANTMSEILKYVSCKNFYPRILKVESSLEKCRENGVLPDHIIPMKGAASYEENIALIEEYDAEVIITKESGEIGGVIDKINAANEKNIAIVMIQRPKINGLNKKDIVSNLEELDQKIKNYL